MSRLIKTKDRTNDIPDVSPMKETKIAKMRTIPKRSRMILNRRNFFDVVDLGSAAAYPSAKAT